MNIKQDLIPIGTGVRTGKKLTDCRGLVVHWIGVGQAKASVIRRNFEREQFGTHYIIDWNTGEIVQCVPEDEVTYHVGSDNGYTALTRKLIGRNNPNWYFVGIECCIGDKAIPGDWYERGKCMGLGKPSDVQYAALVEFAADFLARHGLGVESLYRHYDITGKLCHVWFTKDEARWERFKADVKNRMEDEEMTQEKFDEMFASAMAQHNQEINEEPVSSWAKNSWDKADKAGVFDGSKPTAKCSREQMAVVLDRLGLLG